MSARALWLALVAALLAVIAATVAVVGQLTGGDNLALGRPALPAVAKDPAAVAYAMAPETGFFTSPVATPAITPPVSPTVAPTAAPATAPAAPTATVPAVKAIPSN